MDARIVKVEEEIKEIPKMRKEVNECKEEVKKIDGKKVRQCHVFVMRVALVKEKRKTFTWIFGHR